MTRAFLRSLEREFDPAEVSVSGPPSIRHGRLARGPTARYTLASLDRAAPAPPSEAAPEPAALPAPGLTPAELEAAVAEARAEAVSLTTEAVRVEIEASLRAREVEALEAIGRRLNEHQAAYQAALGDLRSRAREVILGVAGAVAPRAIAQAPLADVERLLEELVPSLGGQPRLELRLAPELVSSGREVLAKLATDRGFRGEVVVEADPSLASSDARLVWERGEAERRTGALIEQALRIAHGWLGPDTDGAGPETRTIAGESRS